MINEKKESPMIDNCGTFTPPAAEVAGSACGCIEAGTETASSLIRFFHAPKRFARRAGDFTANICGAFEGNVKHAQYRLNNGTWRRLERTPPRVPPPLFTIELSPDELHCGTNYLEIEVTALEHKPETALLQFDYDPAPITLPMTIDWSSNDLDVQDGHWENFAVEGEWRVRPTPGFENYDRILVVSGAFAGGRRIETDFVFHENVHEPFGFGVLPLWGGHSDDPGVGLRRGWNLSVAWFYSRYKGVGIEFSYKHGAAQPRTTKRYRHYTLTPKRRYHLVVEVWPEVNASGRHSFYRKRLKWWMDGEPNSDQWLDLADKDGCPLPPREYAVALIAHRSQVDFGSVVIEPL
jgi:hypothetical protein